MTISITTFAILLTSLFVTLKLLGFIAYGWLFVLSPLIFLAAFIFVFYGVVIIAGITALFCLVFLAALDACIKR